MPTKTKMVLFGGEKDGWELEVSPANRPDVFYVVPHEDQPKLESVKSTQAKMELRDKLATLAYKFDPDRSTGNRFRMIRCPELDRVSKS